MNTETINLMETNTLFNEISDVIENVKKNTQEVKGLLHKLYFSIGKIVTSSKDILVLLKTKEILTDALHIPNKSIRLWVERSFELIDNPNLFNYDLWCNGGFIYNDVLC